MLHPFRHTGCTTVSKKQQKTELQQSCMSLPSTAVSPCRHTCPERHEILRNKHKHPPAYCMSRCQSSSRSDRWPCCMMPMSNLCCTHMCPAQCSLRSADYIVKSRSAPCSWHHSLHTSAPRSSHSQPNIQKSIDIGQAACSCRCSSCILDHQQTNTSHQRVTSRADRQVALGSCMVSHA